MQKQNKTKKSNVQNNNNKSILSTEYQQYPISFPFGREYGFYTTAHTYKK